MGGGSADALHKAQSVLIARFDGARKISFSFTLFFLAVMTDSMDHATGIEKREMLMKQAGNDNPFDMKVFKRGPGTKENPNLIPSAFDARLVGCICEEDQTFVQWMWLHQVNVSKVGFVFVSDVFFQF